MERRLRNLRSALCPTDVDVVERARDRCGYCALAPRAARWPVARSSASQICQRAASCEPEAAEAYDAVVVGGGAWGLSVLKLLRDANLRVVCVERGELCQNLRHYMHKMTMHFPTPYMSVLEDDPLLAKGSDHHPSVEDMTEHYVRFAEREDLPVRTRTELIGVSGAKGAFTVDLRDAEGGASQLRAKRVVMATGRYDEPVMTGAPGERGDDVEHFLEAWQHLEGQRLLFVGGGFSSADGVSRLCERNTCAWVTRKTRAQIDSMLADQRTKWGMFEQPTEVIYDGSSVEFFCECEASSFSNGVATIVPSEQEADPIRDHSDNFQASASLPAAKESVAPLAGGQTWQFDRCFMLTGHGPDARLVEHVLGGDCAHDDETWECKTREGVYVCGALSPHHYHLGHIGLLKSPVYVQQQHPPHNLARYNAPELTVDGGSGTDQTRLALRVANAIVADLQSDPQAASAEA